MWVYIILLIGAVIGITASWDACTKKWGKPFEAKKKEQS